MAGGQDWRRAEASRLDSPQTKNALEGRGWRHTEVYSRAPEGQNGNAGFQLNVKELESSRRALDQPAAFLRACFHNRR